MLEASLISSCSHFPSYTCFRRRTLVAIGTHDLDTIEGPFTYEVCDFVNYSHGTCFLMCHSFSWRIHINMLIWICKTYFLKYVALGCNLYAKNMYLTRVIYIHQMYYIPFVILQRCWVSLSMEPSRSICFIWYAVIWPRSVYMK